MVTVTIACIAVHLDRTTDLGDVYELRFECKVWWPLYDHVDDRGRSIATEIVVGRARVPTGVGIVDLVKLKAPVAIVKHSLEK